MANIRAAITGIAGYVPDYVLSNKELEKLVETNDEWILERTGIRERRLLKGENAGTSQLAVPAVLDLLKKTNTQPSEVDLIICCTTTPDMPFPATANIIAAAVGANDAFGYDLSAACSGFLFGLVTGAKFIESGSHKKVIIVGADKMSSIINYQDRNTCIIFGDGAGAVMLEPSADENGLIDSFLRADGAGEAFLHMKGGGSRKPATHESIDAGDHYVYQEGKTVFKFAVNNMSDAVARVMAKNNLTGNDIAFLVPHQANKRIINTVADKMQIAPEKVMMNIEKYGNTTAATIPLCLWDYEHKLKKGDKLMLAAFGGGFTWGAVYLTWAYDPK